MKMNLSTSYNAVAIRTYRIGNLVIYHAVKYPIEEQK
jgi:hypothetical protein